MVRTESIPKLNHTEAERITREATCALAGSKEIYCTVCEQVVRTESIPKLNHTPAERTTAATCSAAGKKETYCTVCEEVLDTS